MGRNRLNFSKDRSNIEQQQSLVGRLLVASPALADTPFARAVVLVMQQDENDTFGIVLNRPADEQVALELKQITGTDPSVDLELIHGGPLNGPVFAIHQSEELGEQLMPGGIYMSSELEIMRQLEEQFAPYRIVLGMAGWGTNQVLAQIKAGDWLELHATPEQIFDEPDWMWQRAVLEYGRKTLLDVTGIQGTPSNPELN